MALAQHVISQLILTIQLVTDMSRGGKPQDVMKRFWSKVIKTETCWNWTAATNCGYGSFRIAGKSVSAHRLSYIWAYKVVLSKSTYICHKCDNRKCVNPEHLFLGTHADNMLDMINKNRQSAPKGENHNKAKLKESQVIEIRKLYNTKIFTQEQLADKFGVDQTLISLISRNKIWRDL